MNFSTRTALLALLLVACGGHHESEDLPLVDDPGPPPGGEGDSAVLDSGPRLDLPKLPDTPLADYADGSCLGLALASFQRDAEGWTQLPNETNGTGRIIFVSASETVRQDNMKFWVKDAKAAFDLMRRGQPDIILFKRGETFPVTVTMPSGNLSGPDIDHVQRVTAYGSGARPILNVTGALFLNFVNTSVSNLAITSLDIVANRPNGETVEGIRFNPKGVSKNILIEDVKISRFLSNIVFYPNTGATMENVQVRRSQILDAYPTKGTGTSVGHSQGMFSTHVDGLLLEENVFDHNGWTNRTDLASEGVATIFNHNAYINSENRCFTAKGNIFSRASSHGLQARSGGIIEDNLFLENPLALSYGAVNGDAVTQKLLPGEGVSGRIDRNVALDTVDIVDDTDGYRRDGGFTLGNTRWVGVRDNVLAHHQKRPGAGGIGFDIDTQMGIGVHNAVFARNVLFDLANGLRVDGGGFGAVTLKNDGENDTFTNESYRQDYFVGSDKVVDVNEAAINSKDYTTPITEMNGADVYLSSTTKRVIRSGKSGIYFPVIKPEQQIVDAGTTFTGQRIREDLGQHARHQSLPPRCVRLLGQRLRLHERGRSGVHGARRPQQRDGREERRPRRDRARRRGGERDEIHDDERGDAGHGRRLHRGRAPATQRHLGQTLHGQTGHRLRPSRAEAVAETRRDETRVTGRAEGRKARGSENFLTCARRRPATDLLVRSGRDWQVLGRTLTSRFGKNSLLPLAFRPSALPVISDLGSAAPRQEGPDEVAWVRVDGGFAGRAADGIEAAEETFHVPAAQAQERFQLRHARAIRLVLDERRVRHGAAEVELVAQTLRDDFLLGELLVAALLRGIERLELGIRHAIALRALFPTCP